jgi:hypothetical protein
MILKYVISKISSNFYVYFNETIFVSQVSVSWDHCRKKFKYNYSIMKRDVDIVHSVIF